MQYPCYSIFPHLYNYYIGLYKENNDIVEESNTDRIIREYDRIQKEINERNQEKDHQKRIQIIKTKWECIRRGGSIMIWTLLH